MCFTFSLNILSYIKLLQNIKQYHNSLRTKKRNYGLNVKGGWGGGLGLTSKAKTIMCLKCIHEKVVNKKKKKSIY